MGKPDGDSEDDKYRELVLGFRMIQLQQLLVFAGQTRTGKKVDLQERVLNLLEKRSKTIYLKIKELSKQQRQIDHQISDPSLSTGGMDSKEDTYSNPYTSPMFDTPVSSPHNLLPTFPDVELQHLPFYDIESVLLKPCSLQPSNNARFQEQSIKFHLTPAQAAAISASCYRNESNRPEYRKQIQMRFSLLETSCRQEDNFPQSISVKVNSRLCPLPPVIPTNKPGAEPKRPPKPINITALSKLVSTGPNNVTISWAVEIGKSYTVSVYLVDNLTHQDLLNRLKDKGERHADFTTALIKDKLKDQDQEIATTACKVSLACPLGKMRMSVPCRSTTCDHLQTFDAKLYLQMNEKKPKWKCPVCNKPALIHNLMIDGFFMELVKSSRLPPDEHEIVLHNDGTWDPLPPKKEECASIVAGPKTENKVAECVPIEDSDSEGGSLTSSLTTPSQTTVPSKRQASEPMKRQFDDDFCITLDSDSEPEEDPQNCEGKRPRLDEAAPNQPPGSPALIIID